MLWTNQNRADIDRYYSGSFVKLAETGEAVLQVLSIHPGLVSLRDSAGELIEVQLHDDQPFEVKQYTPHKAWFQYERNACLLSRKMAKQYYRGISSQNTQIAMLSGNGILTNCSVQHILVEAYVGKPSYITLDMFGENDMESAAIHRRFAVTRSGSVFCDSVVVGEADFKTKTLRSHLPIFQKELTDLCKRSNFTYVGV